MESKIHPRSFLSNFSLHLLTHPLLLHVELRASILHKHVPDYKQNNWRWTNLKWWNGYMVFGDRVFMLLLSFGVEKLVRKWSESTCSHGVSALLLMDRWLDEVMKRGTENKISIVRLDKCSEGFLTQTSLQEICNFSILLCGRWPSYSKFSYCFFMFCWAQWLFDLLKGITSETEKITNLCLFW